MGPVQAGTGHDSALSMTADSKINPGKTGIKTHHVAILATDGADATAISGLMKALVDESAQTAIVATHLGTLKGPDSQELLINWTFQSTASALFDAVYVAGDDASIATLKEDTDAVRFVNEAYRNCKPIAASAAGVALLEAAAYPGTADLVSSEGVVTSADAHVAAIAEHCFWGRELKSMPAI